MKDGLEQLRKAKEEEYFTKRNREALERLKAKSGSKPRLSPITGEPMVQEVINGVVIDRCPTSEGVWLDKGELEALINASHSEEEHHANWLLDFFKGFSGGK